VGHANLSNLSDLWIDLLYAKGKLTIGQAVAVAERRGETLHASEGEYDADSGMVGMGLEQCCAFLLCDARSARDRWGWRGTWDGPFIEPILEVDCWKPRRFRPDVTLAKLLWSCQQDPSSGVAHAAAGDKIEEDGFPEWAAFVRELPRLCEVYGKWHEEEGYADFEDEWEILDRIPWRFCKGKRTGYRDIPRLANITN
jgi:hypothetical protein